MRGTAPSALPDARPNPSRPLQSVRGERHAGSSFPYCLGSSGFSVDCNRKFHLFASPAGNGAEELVHSACPRRLINVFDGRRCAILRACRIINSRGLPLPLIDRRR
jgi:hypothetical protein